VRLDLILCIKFNRRSRNMDSIHKKQNRIDDRALAFEMGKIKINGQVILSVWSIPGKFILCP